MSTIDSLRQQIASCEAKLTVVRQQLLEAEQSQDPRAEEQLSHNSDPWSLTDVHSDLSSGLSQLKEQQQQQKTWPLDRVEYRRYGRQLIMPEIGLRGAS
jgi:adenylyltransferase/sulfurtransferase